MDWKLSSGNTVQIYTIEEMLKDQENMIIEKGYEAFLNTQPKYIVLGVVWDGMLSIPKKCVNEYKVFETKEEVYEYVLKCTRFKVLECGETYLSSSQVLSDAKAHKLALETEKERKQYEILKQKFEF